MLSIRTQDRMALVPYDSAITIVASYKDGKIENKMCELIMPYRISYMVLGTYTTKERALEVLDEIQNKHQYCNSEYTVTNEVYNMPKE